MWNRSIEDEDEDEEVFIALISSRKDNKFPLIVDHFDAAYLSLTCAVYECICLCRKSERTEREREKDEVCICHKTFTSTKMKVYARTCETKL